MTAIAPAAVTAPISNAESIKQRFLAANIAKAAILDDTYDGLTADYLDDLLPQFVVDLEDDDRFAELQRILPDVSDPADFDVDAAKALWDKRQEWPDKIKPLADALFIEYTDKLTRLEKIKAGLEQLGLDVQLFGTDPSKFDALAEVQILLLDYQLAPVPSAATTAAAAAAGAKFGHKIKLGQDKAVRVASSLARGQKRPFLVLISSISNLSEVQAQFRAETNYAGGTFGFLSKEKAADPANLFYHIRGWGIGHPALPAVSDFMSTLQRSAEQVAKEFGQTVLKLEVHDYSFIQKLSLAEDGEPLGEYMLHLLSESLSHRLRNNPAVVAARQKLDGIHFTRRLPSSVVPSDTVSALYREAFTDRSEDPLAPHPLQAVQYPAPTVVFDRVMQGDIFHQAGDKEVHVLINCGCQLQFSPVNPDRQPKPSTMLLLVPGTLREYSEGIAKDDTMRTEPFLIGSKPYRIIWNVDDAMPISRASFKEWCATNGSNRIARLREIQAAAIQQHWAATTARIGLQVAPPFFSSADCELYTLHEGKWKKTGSRIEGKIILTDHVSDKKVVRSFTLTPLALQEIMPSFETAASALEQSLYANQQNDQPAFAAKMAQQQAKIATARQCATDAGELFALVENSHDLERVPNSAWRAEGSLTNLLGFTWECALDGKPENEKIKGMPGKPLLIVNLLTPSSGPAPAEPLEQGLTVSTPEATPTPSPQIAAPDQVRPVVSPDSAPAVTTPASPAE